MPEPRGWHSRGYLPHLDAGSVPQFVTWRQDDAMPASVVERWSEELRHIEDEERSKELVRRIEAYCDEGHGSCLLRNPEASRQVQEVLFAHHLELYRLLSWVVMPNHVHAILVPQPEVTLECIMHRIKGASSRAVNKVAGRSGRLWQPEYRDRVIRSAEHLERATKYIEWNPVKAKLCNDPKHWHWSSANEDSQHRLELLMKDRPAG
ncbi:MAG TPA: transposase [Fimbriimonas sp.]